MIGYNPFLYSNGNINMNNGMGYNAYPSAQVENLIHVQSEEQARLWPMPQIPGTTYKFINDNYPYCYTKTVTGDPQNPMIFKKIRQSLEDDVVVSTNPTPETPEYVTKEDFDIFKQSLFEKFNPYEAKIEDMYSRLEKLKELTD